MHEHRVIEKVLSALEAKVVRQGAWDDYFLQTVLDFLANYADGSHHRKEEQCLFPAMVAEGFPQHGGPIPVMLYEHEIGRAHLRAIRESMPAAREGDAAAKALIQSEARAYVDLLRQHIQKEDMILFRLAHQVLSPAATQVLQRQFADEDAKAHERWENVAESLAGAMMAAG